MDNNNCIPNSRTTNNDKIKTASSLHKMKKSNFRNKKNHQYLNNNNEKAQTEVNSPMKSSYQRI